MKLSNPSYVAALVVVYYVVLSIQMHVVHLLIVWHTVKDAIHSILEKS